MAKKGQDDQALFDAMEAQEREEESIVSQQFGMTEKEVFVDGAGAQSDENDGDNLIEQTPDDIASDPVEDAVGDEAEESDEPDPAEIEAQDEGLEDEGQEDEAPAMVPSSRLRELNRRHAEEMERERERTQEIIRGIGERQQPQPAPQQPPPKPDQFAQPEQYEAWLFERFEQMGKQRFVLMSLDQVKDEYPEEYDILVKRLNEGRGTPEIEAAAKRIFDAPNPGRAMMRWGEKILQDYRDQEDERLYAQLGERHNASADDIRQGLALLQRTTGRSFNRGAEQRPAPSQRSRMLPSLNSAGGSQTATRARIDPRGQNGSEQNIFDSAFQDR